MYTEPTSVLKGRFPVISTSEPNSPTARAKLSATPERIAGARLGSTIRRRIVPGRAPNEAAASSIARSSSSSTGCTERTTNGSVTNSSASPTAARVKVTSMPTGLLLPYSASSTTPATIVGSAKGRSITALTIRLPRKSSRTSTHATSVPKTALMSATISDATSVSLIAATASLLEISRQKASMPPLVDLATSAAIGARTSAVR